jgi:predicted secreted protein
MDKKRVVFVSHCLLNQAIRPSEDGRYPNVTKELFTLFAEHEIGIVQLPCPRMESNDFTKKLVTKENVDNKKYRTYCQKLSENMLKQVEMYLKQNYSVIGILGVEFSASCAVHQIKNGGKNSPGKGVLLEELEKTMQKKNFQVPIIGINLNNIYSSIEKLQSLINFT